MLFFVGLAGAEKMRAPPCIALIASAWLTAAFGFVTKLFMADHRQYWPQPLVIGDSEINVVIADRKSAVGMVNAAWILNGST